MRRCAFALVVDLASAEGPAWMVEETVRRAGRLDVLVNCAAVAPAEAFLDDDRRRLAAGAAGQRPGGRARDGGGRPGDGRAGRRADHQRDLGGRAHGAARLRRLCRDQGRGRFADPLGGGGARQARRAGQQPLARDDGHAPAAAHREGLLRAGRPRPTSKPSRPSAPRASRSAGAAIPRRWRRSWSGSRPMRPTT